LENKEVGSSTSVSNVRPLPNDDEEAEEDDDEEEGEDEESDKWEHK
jgi:hypothetical protein